MGAALGQPSLLLLPRGLLSLVLLAWMACKLVVGPWTLTLTSVLCGLLEFRLPRHIPQESQTS